MSSRRASRGPPIGVKRPICCVRSSSVPISSSLEDSFDPFCTSQIVAPMNSENWRNSDCQFSISAPAKDGEITYDHHEIASAPCSARSAFSACWPATDCAPTVPTNSARKKSDSPLSRANRFTAALVSSLREADRDAGSAAGDDDHEIGEEHSSHAGVSYPCRPFHKREPRAVAQEGERRDVCGGSPAGYHASVSEMPVTPGRLRQSPVERHPPSLPG